MNEEGATHEILNLHPKKEPARNEHPKANTIGRLRGYVTNRLPDAIEILKKSGLDPETYGRMAINIAGKLVRKDLESKEDQLTGLLNRKGIEQREKEELERAIRQKEKIALIMLDLNFLKITNDTKGHLAGDELLRDTGRILGNETRITDAAGRLGGDEFKVILSNASPEATQEYFKRLNEQFVAHGINIGAGYAIIDGGKIKPTDNLEEILSVATDQADKALYPAKAEAKKTGKNTIINFTSLSTGEEGISQAAA